MTPAQCLFQLQVFTMEFLQLLKCAILGAVKIKWTAFVTSQILRAMIELTFYTCHMDCIILAKRDEKAKFTLFVLHQL